MVVDKAQFSNKTLLGKRVLVTRSRTQASVLSRLLKKEGAIPLEVHAIEIQPMDNYDEITSALQRLEEYDWVIFASVNGVEVVFCCLQRLNLDARGFDGVKVAAIGPATAKALQEKGITVDFTPDRYLSDGLIEGFKAMNTQGMRVLLPRASVGQDSLVPGLRTLGAQVHQIPVYKTVIPLDSSQKAQEIFSKGVDIVTFTSSSTVRNLISLLGGKTGLLEGSLIACIGPVTANTAREMGLKVDVVAREHTIPGLVQSLVEAFQKEER
ncbi:MAG: uroporphyrinogen-III synthase [Chloroflexi bacterium]|nr:uroporphyrinogen-III synthase [Chloroflexota bacterium]